MSIRRCWRTVRLPRFGHRSTSSSAPDSPHWRATRINTTTYIKRSCDLFPPDSPTRHTHTVYGCLELVLSSDLNQAQNLVQTIRQEIGVVLCQAHRRLDAQRVTE